MMENLQAFGLGYVAGSMTAVIIFLIASAYHAYRETIEEMKANGFIN